MFCVFTVVELNKTNKLFYFFTLEINFLFLIWFCLDAVMQFGGQHPGGMGVPAVGMAFPGYVANPQLGLGKSEMTWYIYIF